MLILDSLCERGQFFNMTTLLCENCDPGHYSLGGGIIIDSFNGSLGHLPNGFHIATESTKHNSELNKKCNGIISGCLNSLLYNFDLFLEDGMLIQLLTI